MWQSLNSGSVQVQILLAACRRFAMVRTMTFTGKFVYVCMYIYVYIYIYNHKNNVPSRLSSQWLCGNSCTWADDVQLRTSCAQVHELPQSHYGDNLEGTLFS